mmetsp:Transcript_22632/g.57809  ORF Transcript_22632/g.57809 Transcript_22632/m.57809 type:complete len:569 (-) Transcript_22632:89-1795(-)
MAPGSPRDPEANSAPGAPAAGVEEGQTSLVNHDAYPMLKTAAPAPEDSRPPAGAGAGPAQTGAGAEDKENRPATEAGAGASAERGPGSPGKKSIAEVDTQVAGGRKLMTPEAIAAILKQQNAYDQPELNDVLYLHFQGFRNIGGLDAFYKLACLYLESNSISQIEGLEKLTRLRQLFLQQNCIQEITGLDTCTRLVKLNLAHNAVTQVTGLDKLKALTSIDISHNAIATVEALEGLKVCPVLSSVDASYNKVEATEGVVQFWSSLGELAVLYYHHNPGQRHMSQYRRRMVSGIKKLRFLDERPVTPVERVGAEAWVEAEATGGKEAGKQAEAEARTKYMDWERHGTEKDRADFRKVMDAAHRRIQLGLQRIERMEAEKKAEKERREKEGADATSKKFTMIDQKIIEVKREAAEDDAEREQERQREKDQARRQQELRQDNGRYGPSTAAFRQSDSGATGPWPMDPDSEQALWDNAGNSGDGRIGADLRARHAAAVQARAQASEGGDVRAAARAGMSSFLGSKGSGQNKEVLAGPFFQPPARGVMGLAGGGQKKPKARPVVSRSELDEMD